MSLFSRREERRFVPYQQTGFDSLPNFSGETVNEDTALQVTAVMACVGLIADSVASLPMKSVRQVGDRHVAEPLPEFLARPSQQVTL